MVKDIPVLTGETLKFEEVMANYKKVLIQIARVYNEGVGVYFEGYFGIGYIFTVGYDAATGRRKYDFHTRLWNIRSEKESGTYIRKSNNQTAYAGST